MPDPTEAARRALVPTMPAELAARVAAGEQVWNTAEMQAEFEAIGFAALLELDGLQGRERLEPRLPVTTLGAVPA